MHTLVPLTVAVPFMTAAFIAAFGHFLTSRIDDALALVAAAATTGICIALVVGSADAPIHTTFGDWEPRRNVVLGIVFSVDPLAAAVAALAALLATASLVASWRYFDEVGHIWAVLVLVFLGGMVGFALSDDIFNMFVWFEVMGVAAFALTAYRADEPGPLHGALNFAVLNTIGALCFLLSIALLYGRTGALNLAQMGHALTGPPDRLVVASFVLLLVAFLTKAGAVPFHFWLSDAYSVAPVPVCVLLSGVMSDLGIHGITRIFWPVLSETLAGREADVRATLVAVGVATCVVGGVMAFMQANLKRMLAFVTICHVGVFVIGIGLLTADALAGTTIFVVADGLVKGALFLCVGVLVSRLRDVNELRLFGRGRDMRFTPVVFAVGVLGLAQVPPFGTFLGVSMLDDAARGLGWGWLAPVVMVTTGIAAGAVLRAGTRIFLGVGERDDEFLVAFDRPDDAAEEEPEEGATTRRHRIAFMVAPAAALLVVGFGLAFAPHLADHAIRSAEHFVSPAHHFDEVVEGKPAPPPGPFPGYAPSPGDYLYAVGTVFVALAFAGFGLFRRRLTAAFGEAGARLADVTLGRLALLHTGVIGEYVTWLTVGAAVLGGIFALTLT